jgi:hypothetical protein
MLKETGELVENAGEETKGVILEALCEQYQRGVNVLIDKERLYSNMGGEMVKINHEIIEMQKQLIVLEKGEKGDDYLLDIRRIINMIGVANDRLDGLSDALFANLEIIMDLNAGFISVSKEIAV